MRKLSIALLAGSVSLAATTAARAVLIAADSFETTAAGAGSTYTDAANLNGQAATAGTTGYYTGTATGNQVAGWASGTGAFTSVTTPALTHPRTVGAPTGVTPDGSVRVVGNANTRQQYRDFATVAPSASATYYFSALMRESANSYTGTTFAGVGPSQAANLNGSVPATGFDVGFVNGAITLFSNRGATDFLTAGDQSTLVATPTANSTYLVEVAATVVGTTATLTPSVYDATGTLVNNPVTQTVTATLNPATDLGAFELQVTNNFNAGAPAQVNFDEFRFGTAESDVVATPEPAAASLLGIACVGLLARRRRTVTPAC